MSRALPPRRLRDGAAAAAAASRWLRATLPAGRAAPGPPLGPLLGQRGIPVGPFCQDFNARTGGLREGLPLRVRLRGRPDGSYELRIGPPPSSYFLKSVAGIEKGAGRPGHEVAGLVTLPQLYEVALALGRGLQEGRGDAPPAPPPSPTTLRRRVGALVGTARSLGLRVLPRLSAEDCAAFQRRRREELEAAREAAAAAEEAARKK